MEPSDLIDLILQHEHDWIEAISTGAGWELWGQVEVSKYLLRRYGVMGREVPYSGSTKSVDIAVQIAKQNYFIEMKVESARNSGTFAGESLLKAVGDDLAKIRQFEGQGHIWVLVIAYSIASKSELLEMSSDAPTFLYKTGKVLGIAVLNAESW